MPAAALAKALGVGPTTIHFHFEGGVGSVVSAVAQEALAGVTRPFKPKDEPAAYLGELLLKKILQALHARPVVAKLVVLQLSSNAVLHPLLAERLLLALGALGLPTEARPIMFQRAMGVIFEMILAGCGRSGAAESRIAGVRPYSGRAMCDHISQERQRRRCDHIAFSSGTNPSARVRSQRRNAAQSVLRSVRPVRNRLRRVRGRPGTNGAAAGPLGSSRRAAVLAFSSQPSASSSRASRRSRSSTVSCRASPVHRRPRSLASSLRLTGKWPNGDS